MERNSPPAQTAKATRRTHTSRFGIVYQVIEKKLPQTYERETIPIEAGDHVEEARVSKTTNDS
jgi:hypothetical protein